MYIYVHVYILRSICAYISIHTQIYTSIHTHTRRNYLWNFLFCHKLLSRASVAVSETLNRKQRPVKGVACEARSRIKSPTLAAIETELGICTGEAALPCLTLTWSMRKARVENMIPFMRAAGRFSWMAPWISETWWLKQRESWWGLAGWKCVI